MRGSKVVGEGREAGAGLRTGKWRRSMGREGQEAGQGFACGGAWQVVGGPLEQ